MEIPRARQEAIIKVNLESWENAVFSHECNLEAAKKTGNSDLLKQSEDGLSSALKMLSFYEGKLKALPPVK